MVELIGSVFQGPGREGDFGWMIAQPRFAHAFFIFNDNETQWRAHRDDPAGSLGCAPGGGNAVIRPYQCAHPPRALGIPTGDSGAGFDALSDHVRSVIDAATDGIADSLAAHGYGTVYYSSDGADGLGTGIFSPAPEVTGYIMTRLRGLARDGGARPR